MKRDIEDFVTRLSKDEKVELLALLQEASMPDLLIPDRNELLRAELWFTRRMEIATRTRFYHTRTRMWLIFMLLRHAGLRLREIFALQPEDCGFGNAKVSADGRVVPLSREVARRMAAVWNSWPGKGAAYPFECESSQIRRVLAKCAEACSIVPEKLSASKLRRLRGHELEAEGLHPRLAAWFLGTVKSPAPFDEALALHLIETHILTGGKVKTSARNVFKGQITKVNKNGILVEVALETESGLAITAIITNTSCQNMQLAPGKVMTAMVKAPWVNVLPRDERAEAAPVNCYEGKVESLQRDNMACEILVELSKGARVCSLYANGASPATEIAPGASVVVHFSPFSVILTEN